MSSILLIIVGGGIGAIVVMVIVIVICKKFRNWRNTKATGGYKWSLVDMAESNQQDDDFVDEENIRTIERSEMVQSHSNDEDSDDEDYYSVRGDGSTFLLRSNTVSSQDYHSIRGNKLRPLPRSNTR